MSPYVGDSLRLQGGEMNAFLGLIPLTNIIPQEGRYRQVSDGSAPLCVEKLTVKGSNCLLKIRHSFLRTRTRCRLLSPGGYRSRARRGYPPHLLETARLPCESAGSEELTPLPGTNPQPAPASSRAQGIDQGAEA